MKRIIAALCALAVYVGPRSGTSRFSVVPPFRFDVAAAPAFCPLAAVVRYAVVYVTETDRGALPPCWYWTRKYLSYSARLTVCARSRTGAAKLRLDTVTVFGFGDRPSVRSAPAEKYCPLVRNVVTALLVDDAVTKRRW